MMPLLKSHQVFIFGSNSTGFHGAGAAGLACRGDAANTWRADPWFLKAMKSKEGSEDRIGRWAVYGVARGYQVGKEGASYAIETIKKPGQLCSTSLEEIKEQLIELAKFAIDHPEFEFIMSPIGTGYAGWKPEQMKVIWKDVTKFLPKNILYDSDLYDSVNVLNT